MKKLTVSALCEEAKPFAERESAHDEPAIYGVTDGKAVGTYFEHKFQTYLRGKYAYVEGSTAKGIDFPELDVDMKVTSSSSPSPRARFSRLARKSSVSDTLSWFSYMKRRTTSRRAQGS